MSSRSVTLERLVAWAIVAGGLLLHGPLFLRSPLGPDPVMYDLQAQLVRDGGTLYRDILEPNLPGAVWLHLLVRSVAGWSSEALRVFDLLWFGVAVWLAVRLAGCDRRTGLLVAIVLATGYSTLSEWCHCQRDVWMLPFVLGAVSLRIRRLEAHDAHEGGLARLRHGIGSALAEGLLWGAAVWLKPHVVVPAVCVIVASWCVPRPSGVKGRRILTDEAVVILGGSLVGLAGIAWLIEHNAWTPFWSILTEWNRDYVAASGNRWSWARLWSVQERLAPWSLVHVVAIPVSMAVLWRQLKVSAKPGVAASHSSRAVIASALYLGWIAQSLLLQHLFDYVHVPALVLGAVVLISVWAIPSEWEWSPTRLALAGALCLVPSFALRSDQLAAWPRCFGREASPGLRAALARLPLPEWTHLARVEGFLRDHRVADGELTAYHTHTIHVYPALQVRPSTRYVFTETHLRLFPGRSGEIAEALRDSRQRYVVSDLLEAGLDPAVALDDSQVENWRFACPRGALNSFPYDQPVVFRSGPYLVHEVTGPVGPVETAFFPLAAESAGL
ncbi:hypothetical protein Pan44_52640 [Caulifigura coniformis]|uniref:Glycosyltransferase RgtA/B/C/D-like domain-containing protein n=1 Tax=Caulifigura coniformis TaxID=2527983 RepID=A0A517SM49_9PLAN|nr:hypothetical protein [Caulifigura coniformis]QDT57197.1 hypothetical protein Pan44_52640 [Caulifigura coniformis]